MRLRSLVRWIVVLALVPFSARAQMSHEEQSESYRRGRAAMTAQDWEGAYKIFSELWKVRPTYDVALNLGQAELQLGKYRDAAEHLDFGIAGLVPREKPEVAERSRKGLDRAKQRVATLKIIVDRPNAEIYLDGQLVGTSPLARSVYVDGGPHSVRVSLAGHASAESTFEAEPGRSQLVQVNVGDPVAKTSESAVMPPAASGLEELPGHDGQPGAEQPEPRPNPARTVVLITGGAIAGIAAGSGLLFTIKGSSADSDADAFLRRATDEAGPTPCRPGTSTQWCSRLGKALDDRNHANQIANWSFVIAGAAVAATAITYLALPSESAPARASFQLVPFAEPKTGGLILHGSF